MTRLTRALLALNLLILCAASLPLSAATLDEALNTTNLTWSTSGDALWSVETSQSHDGVAAAQAGAIGYGQSSMLSAPVTGPGTLVFWASLETGAGGTELSVGYDNGIYLSLYEQSEFVGLGWHAYALEVPAGAHVLNFNFRCYASDPAAINTQHAWVDQVSFGDRAQAPALVSEPADVELNEDYPWYLAVPLTGVKPFDVLWSHTGQTYHYLGVNQLQAQLNVDRVYTNFAGGWQLIVTNQYGSVTSRVFSVTVKPSPPLVRSGPNSTDVGLGSPLQLNVSAAGTAPLKYQWQKGGADLPGQTDQVLSIGTTIPSDAGDYRLVVTNLYGAATSHVATVTLSTNPPKITQQLENQTALPGSGAGFWISCEGSTPLHYQWQKDGVDISGATDSGVWIPSATPTDSGSYRVVITNLFGKVTSDPATLLVVDPVADALDSTNLVFANYDYLTSWTIVTDITHDGQDAMMSPPIEDNGHTGISTVLTGPGTLSFWWKVSSEADQDVMRFLMDDSSQAEISGEMDWQQEIINIGPGEHQILWLYSKDAGGSAGSDAAWLDQVSWAPKPPITFAQALDAPDLTFETGDPIPWETQMVTSHDGVDAAQAGPTQYGQTSSLNLTLTGAGRISFWCRTSSSDLARLKFYLDGNERNSLSGESGWQQLTFALSAGTHTLTWSFENYNFLGNGMDNAWLDEVVWAPDWLAEAVDAPQLEFAVDDNLPWLGQTNTTHDGVDAAQSTVPPVNERSWCQTSITGPGTLTFWALISAAPEDSLEFTLDYTTKTLWMGESDWMQFTYEIQPGTHLVGWGFRKRTEQQVGLNAAFLDEVVFTPRTAPTISTPPQSVKLLKGKAFQLSVTAVGESQLAYQWLKDGINIPGATGDTYGRSGCGYADMGNYAVVVTNNSGSVTSSLARVVVAPTFYTIQNLGTLSTNGGTSEAFDVNDSGEVVGNTDINESKSYGNRLYHGFVWTGRSGGMVDLGDGRIAVNVDATNHLAGYSSAVSINNSFDIVGYYEYRVDPKLDGYGHAAYWRQINCGVAVPAPVAYHCPVELVDIHPRDIYVYPPDTEAVAINSRRQILLEGGRVWTPADYVYLTGPTDHWDRFSPFKSKSLGAGTGWATPYGMNNSGVIVGRYREFIGGDMPCIYDGLTRVGSEAITNIFPVPASQKRFSAINDRGVIAGIYSTNTIEGYMVRYAFLLHPGGYLELMSNPNQVLNLYDIKDINNRNQVVGSGVGGLLYMDGYGFALNDLVTGGSGVNITTANAINDAGQIVGQAQFPGIGNRAYLLTPGISGNHNPVAHDKSFTWSRRQSVLIPAATLLANDTDPDGDQLCLTSVAGDGLDGATQGGGRVTREGNNILYTLPGIVVASDSFTYGISDGFGGTASALVTINFSDSAPLPTPLINPPKNLPDGTVQLSGQAPQGSTVWIYRSVDALASQWTLDMTLTVSDSGQWTVTRPGIEGGHHMLYRAEVQTPGQ